MENLKEIRFIVCSWGNPDQDKEYELWDFISENYLEKKKKISSQRSFDDWYTETYTWLAVLGEELKRVQEIMDFQAKMWYIENKWIENTDGVVEIKAGWFWWTQKSSKL